MNDPTARAAHPFASDAVHILDGGLATQLEATGHVLSGALWSAGLLLDAPAPIGAAHLAYVRAGADVLTTASYQLSQHGLQLDERSDVSLEEAVQRSVTVAREAASHRTPSPWVAGSIGSFGAAKADGSEFRGDYDTSVQELAAFHAPRFEALCRANVDILACETLPMLREAQALAIHLRSQPNVAAWMTFTTPNGATTPAGEPLAEVAAFVDGVPSVAAVGVNCCSPAFVLPALLALRQGTSKPLVAYANSGETWDATARGWVGDASGWVTDTDAWIEAGVRLVGGCCRTTPDDVAALVARHRTG